MSRPKRTVKRCPVPPLHRSRAASRRQCRGTPPPRCRRRPRDVPVPVTKKSPKKKRERNCGSDLPISWPICRNSDWSWMVMAHLEHLGTLQICQKNALADTGSLFRKCMKMPVPSGIESWPVAERQQAVPEIFVGPERVIQYSWKAPGQLTTTELCVCVCHPRKVIASAQRPFSSPMAQQFSIHSQSLI